jgi:hypothetical protein
MQAKGLYTIVSSANHLNFNPGEILIREQYLLYSWMFILNKLTVNHVNNVNTRTSNYFYNLVCAFNTIQII